VLRVRSAPGAFAEKFDRLAAAADARFRSFRRLLLLSSRCLAKAVNVLELSQEEHCSGQTSRDLNEAQYISRFERPKFL